MTIVAHINESLGIRVHILTGIVTPREGFSLAQFYRANESFLKTDLISVVDESAESDPALEHHLDTLRDEYRTLHGNADFILQRRSAWVCPNLRAWRLLEEWLRERHARDGQGTEVCLVAALPEIAILFEQDEIDAIRHWRDFRELTRISEPSNDGLVSA